MPKVHRAFARTRRQFELWTELMQAVDSSPIPVPCTNFPDLFFPDSEYNSALGDIRQAQKLCKQCPIILDCARYGLEAKEDYGVWGGLTPYDRKKLRNKHGSLRNASEALKIRYRKLGADGLQRDRG